MASVSSRARYSTRSRRALDERADEPGEAVGHGREERIDPGVLRLHLGQRRRRVEVPRPGGLVDQQRPELVVLLLVVVVQQLPERPPARLQALPR
jgi:hypothetical protein